MRIMAEKYSAIVMSLDVQAGRLPCKAAAGRAGGDRGL